MSINGSKSRNDHGCSRLAMRSANMISVMDVPLGPLLGTHRYIHAAGVTWQRRRCRQMHYLSPACPRQPGSAGQRAGHHDSRDAWAAVVIDLLDVEAEPAVECDRA